MILKPDTPRQLGEDGLLVLWRDGLDPGQREGLVSEMDGELIEVLHRVVGEATAKKRTRR